jgi:hypothetical protein
MKKVLAGLMSVVFFASLTAVAEAQSNCPAEVAKAKQMLSQKAGVAKTQPVQAPRSLAGARGQDAQAPRGQDAQAPRGQDAQAPRGQDAQAPRGQDAQAPRSLAGAKVTGSDVSKASTLIKEAEAACKAGDMKTAKSKAQSALTILR